jgi:hypothetical protein
MPRVKRFRELPAWLQQRLKADWATVNDGPAPNHPPIDDPEYRVHRVGDSGWWAVDAGTGGVSIEREGESHAYDDLPEGKPLKTLVDAVGRSDRDSEHIELLFGMVRAQGAVDPRRLAAFVERIRGDGNADVRVIRELCDLLHRGLFCGDWRVD